MTKKCSTLRKKGRCYTLGTSGFHYGVDFPDNVNDFGQVNQFAQTTECGGPFGPDSTYCDTIFH